MALSQKERDFILNLARASIEAGLAGKDKAPSQLAPPESQALLARSGVFVTLHESGGLRGCIGNFTSDLPLYKNVAEMAHSAAFSDPRFSPVRADELPLIDIEISVLSPMREIRDVSEIEVGRHGLFIQKGYARGVLLPQVATENNFDCETFLEHTCMKAGLPADCWQKGAKIFVFEAEIFGEADKTP